MTMKGDIEDLTGKKFHRWTVLENRGYDSQGKSQWLCRCDCGTLRVVSGYSLKKAKGGSKSCGCLAKELLAARNTFAAKHNMSDSRLYRIWAEIKQRCYNPKATSYENYGGRGIKMCNAWLDSFESFFEWSVANGYSDKLSIDRINSDGDYEPSNCRWADATTQANNTRSNRIISFNGKTLTVAQWAKELNVSDKLLRSRLDAGWDFQRAVLQRKQRKSKFQKLP